MEIAFVTAEYPPRNVGGAGISSKLIVQNLRDYGHAVDVYVLSNDQTTDVKLEKDYTELRHAQHLFSSDIVNKNIAVYTQFRNNNEYDLIHVYGPSHLPGVITTSNVPVIATIVNFSWVCINPEKYLKDGCPQYNICQAFMNSRSRYSGFKSIMMPIVESIGKLITSNVDLVTVQTEGMRSILLKCGYDNSIMRTIPNILDESFYKREDEKSKNNKNMVFIGRLSKKKGVDDIIRTYLSLPNQIRNEWELKIYGSGPLKDSIQQCIGDNPEENITLSYCAYDKLPYSVYSTADIVIHGSKWPEPFSRVWLEALASRTPLVCSENPSSKYVLEDLAEFYDPFDTKSLYQSLMKVIYSPKYRRELAENGQKMVTQYEAKNIVPKYIESYHDIKR